MKWERKLSFFFVVLKDIKMIHKNLCLDIKHKFCGFIIGFDKN